MERNTGQLAFTQAFPACYAPGCSMDGWEDRWQREQQSVLSPQVPSTNNIRPSSKAIRRSQPQRWPQRSIGSTAYVLALVAVYGTPIVPSIVDSAEASVVRVGASYHMVIADRMAATTTCRVEHWQGSVNASLPWSRVEIISVKQRSCGGVSLYWNSDATRWELLVRGESAGSWLRLFTRVGGFDALSSRGDWAKALSNSVLNASGAVSAPFYDTTEGRWHRLLAASPGLELAAADHIAGPYSRTGDAVGLPTWASPAAGAAVCSWSGDSTHFAVFPAANSSHFGFCFSWDAVTWPSAPTQRVELPHNFSWAKQITKMHAVIEDPLHHGRVSIFFTGTDAAGNDAAVGVMQAMLQYA